MLKDEELKNKYIKYSPEITEEIYNRIIKRLAELNIKKWVNSNTFEHFKSKQRLIITKDKDYFIPTAIDTADNNNTEISYKDIIGEDEWWKSLKIGDYVVAIKNSQGGYFINHIYEIKHCSSSGLIDTMLDSVGSTTNGWGYMNFRPATSEEIAMYEHAGKPVDITTYVIPKSEEFTLPEEWCVKITENNHKDIWKWTKWVFDYANHHKYCTSRKTHSDAFPDTKPYKEITFEQFKEHVMKEEKKDKIPEYVECIEEYYGLKRGTIYKIEKEFIIGASGRPHYSTVFVKSSTKEAYDAQFKSSPTQEKPVSLTVKDSVEEDDVFYGQIISNYIYKKVEDKYYWLTDTDFGYDNTTFNKLRVATPEEKQWLNVCIQENKFIEKNYALRGYDMWGKSLQLKPTFKSRVNFKIGDKVEAICNPTPFREVEHTNWDPLSKKGEIVTVKALSTKHPDLFQVEEWEHWFMEDQFKLVEKVKPVFQVHDKCNIGDIIVSLEPQSRTVTSRRNGDLLRVLEKSIKEKLHYGDSFSILQENSNTYRLATPQEIQLFNQGIKNIYETMEYKLGDWITIENRKNLQPGCTGCPEGTYQIVSERNHSGLLDKDEGFNVRITDSNVWRISSKGVRKATSEEIAKATSSVELVVGNWYELHSCGSRWIFKFLKFGNSDEIWNSISATPHDNYTDKSEGYLTGKLENCKPADMEEVYRLFPKEKSEEITSYDGLKVGDVLPEKVICAWADKDYNWICLSDFKPTWKKSGGFMGDRRIESFKNIDGYISFLVSGTDKVYMKASGFKAFMESYGIRTEVKYNPDEWGWEVIPFNKYYIGSDPAVKDVSDIWKLPTLTDYSLTPDDSVKQDVISPILFNVKKI